MKKVTVIVTVFNKEKYIQQCLESILKQSCKDFRLIIVDDGSTDDSYRICDRLCKKHHKGELVRKKHGGAADAKNYGLSMVKTEYVTFVDGDDCIVPDAVEQIYRMLADQPQMLVYGINYIMPDNRCVFSLKRSAVRCSGQKEICAELVGLWSSELMYSACNKCFSTEIIRKHALRFPDKSFGEDMSFVCGFLSYCQTITLTERCLYNYRQQNENSLSKANRDDWFHIRKEEHNELAAFFRHMKCSQADAKEYLDRHFTERLLGCIEYEASIKNKNKVSVRFRNVKNMLADALVRNCVKDAKLNSRKAKVIVWFIRHRFSCFTFLIGFLISFVKNSFPKLFVILKMKR